MTSSKMDRVMMNNKGVTLTELIVVMAIFIIIMMVTSYSFERMLGVSTQLTKRAESNIEGIVGLEMLRSDIEHAGYGLPWSFQNSSAGLTYQEVGSGTDTLADGIDSSTFNDAFPNAPRAIISGNCSKEVSGASAINGGPEYLVVKSTIAPINSTAKKWTFINYTASGGTNLSYIKAWAEGDNIQNKDRVITINSTFTTAGKPNRQLVMQSSAPKFYYIVNGAQPPDAYKPGDASQLYLVYGVNTRDDTTTPLTMPYNRADYYIKKPDSLPKSCNPNTGILYKGVSDNNGGSGVTEYPLLDCVADMQVIYRVDTNNDGNLTNFDLLTPASTFDAAYIREHIKEVRIYILAHEGTLDRSFTYTTDPSVVIRVGETGLGGRTWSQSNLSDIFGTDWIHYRWKVYTLIVRPKNLY